MAAGHVVFDGAPDELDGPALTRVYGAEAAGELERVTSVAFDLSAITVHGLRRACLSIGRRTSWDRRRSHCPAGRAHPREEDHPMVTLSSPDDPTRLRAHDCGGTLAGLSRAARAADWREQHRAITASIISSENQADLLTRHEPFRAYLERELRVKVRITTGTDYAGTIEAMRARKAELAIRAGVLRQGMGGHRGATSSHSPCRPTTPAARSTSR